MSSNEQTAPTPPLDIAKLTAAVALVLGAVFAFYWFEDVSWAVRTVGVILAIGAAIALAAFTNFGGRARHFLSESQFELRKVVWPTRQETVQTTIVIMVVVLIIALILWVIDMILGQVILEWLLKPGG